MQYVKPKSHVYLRIPEFLHFLRRVHSKKSKARAQLVRARGIQRISE
jgi:hypothetical protein